MRTLRKQRRVIGVHTSILRAVRWRIDYIFRMSGRYVLTTTLICVI
ncbi:hypothetical protein J4772_29685 [Cohnella sp. LGH]|nr:hypothetical protein J4772_29685 [Cohnella sp. LGH]